jgi:hypothetical protein
VAIVDSTFDIGKDKYILTIVMAYYATLAVPCAFIISTKKDEFTYSIYFKVKFTTL